MTKLLSGDRIFVMLVAALALLGLAVFSSASLGLLARATGSVSKDILFQTTFGLGVGIIGFFGTLMVPLDKIKKYAPHVYIATLLLTLLVFVPGIGFHSGGATRWLNLRITTLQPAEFLKIGFVLAVAWWFAPRARQLRDMKKGLFPFAAIAGVPAVILLAQPNTSTTMLLLITGAIMYFAAGAPKRDFGILALTVIVSVGLLILVRPYALQRIKTFIDPGAHSLSSGYQIQQSLIAVGSGGITGRGFGQSVEKFNYLPEPDGDSIFAVYAEETGFIGALILLMLFLGLAARGIVIAGKSTNLFGGLVALGFSFLIIFQAFINISAMLGIVPLTGLPLPFISHGGTALATTLIMCGLILNVAARRKA